MYTPTEVLHCGNRNCRPLFGCCDLDLDPMTFIDELKPYTLKTYRMCINKRRTLKLSKVIAL